MNAIYNEPIFNTLLTVVTFLMAVGCSSNTAQKKNSEQSEPQVFTKQMQASISPQGALEKLKRGNERF